MNSGLLASDHPCPHRRMRRRFGCLPLRASFLPGLFLWACGLEAQEAGATKTPAAANAPSLDEMRLAMSKWIETQQIIAKERKDWQKSKEILTSRIELRRQE